jgi:hypothetical protein
VAVAIRATSMPRAWVVADMVAMVEEWEAVESEAEEAA